MPNADDSQGEDEFRLAPLDTEIDAVRERGMARTIFPPVPELENRDPRFQFKIWHIMLVTILVAMTVASLEWFPVNFVAGFLGTLTLVSLVVVLCLGERHPKLRLLWAVLMMLYLTIAVWLTVQFALAN